MSAIREAIIRTWIERVIASEAVSPSTVTLNGRRLAPVGRDGLEARGAFRKVLRELEESELRGLAMVFDVVSVGGRKVVAALRQPPRPYSLLRRVVEEVLRDTFPAEVTSEVRDYSVGRTPESPLPQSPRLPRSPLSEEPFGAVPASPMALDLLQQTQPPVQQISDKMRDLAETVLRVREALPPGTAKWLRTGVERLADGFVRRAMLGLRPAESHNVMDRIERVLRDAGFRRADCDSLVTRIGFAIGLTGARGKHARQRRRERQKSTKQGHT